MEATTRSLNSLVTSTASDCREAAASAFPALSNYEYQALHATPAVVYHHCGLLEYRSLMIT